MAANQQARLAVELEYYVQHKTEWLAHKTGLYVVIKDGGVLGFYPNFEAAYRAGAATYGLSADFLVKQILEHEPVFFVF
jgi:S-formylglutathione hydrolase FrmB